MHLVGDDHAGHAVLAGEGQDEVVEDGGGDGVEAGAGLVVEHDHGLDDQGAGDADALAHAAGKLGRHEIIDVAEADVGGVEEGQDVEFTVDAYPDNTFHGTVDQIRIAPITVQNVVTYDVVVKVNNGDLKLKPGMTANVSVIVASKDGVLKIPNAALRFRPSEKDIPAAKTSSVKKTSTGPSGSSDGTSARFSGSEKDNGQPSSQTGKGGAQAAPKSYTIWILENNKPKRAQVTIGISDGSFTEITSGDVTEGQAVITETATNTAKKNVSTSPSSSPMRFPR